MHDESKYGYSHSGLGDCMFSVISTPTTAAQTWAFHIETISA